MKRKELKIERDDRRNLYVNRGDCSFEFMRSGGKGGQHRDKAETKVRVSIEIGALKKLSDEEKEGVRRLWASRIHNDKLSVTIQSQRSREQNIKIALNELNDMVAKGREPEKERIPTEPSERARQKRFEEKQKVSRLKRERVEIKDFE